VSEREGGEESDLNRFQVTPFSSESSSYFKFHLRGGSDVAERREGRGREGQSRQRPRGIGRRRRSDLGR
jgi:hypothetical protein